VRTKSVAAKRDPHRDFRAADLQEQPTKPVESRADFSHGCFVGFDEDGGSPAKIAASGASRRPQRAPASGAIKLRIARRRAEDEGGDTLFVPE
jgi:hypothetical protein